MPSLRVLIVDDSRASRMMLKSCLAGVECETEEAENGEIAVEKCKTGLFDLVIMDVHMPQLDGYEAARMIRGFEKEKNRAPVPMVAVTAIDPAQAAIKTQAAGFTAFTTKPVKAAALQEVLKSATQGKFCPPEPETSPTAPDGKDNRGRLRTLLAGFSTETDELASALKQHRSMFLSEKKNEVSVAIAAMDFGDFGTVRNLAYRLKGEGSNFGYTKISDFGKSLVQSVEKRDIRTARLVAQKLLAYLARAIEQMADQPSPSPVDTTGGPGPK